MKRYKAVLFDLDGTLIDTIQDIAYHVNTLLEQNGKSPRPYKDYYGFVGWGIKEAIRMAFEGDIKDTRLDELKTEMFNLYNETPIIHTTLFEGIPKLLDTLNENKIPIAILSNKADEITVKIADLLLKKWDFAHVRGARKGIPKKPHPLSALEISRELNIPAEDILYVGDSDVDIKTARRAGMFPLGVSWGYRDISVLKRAGAQVIADKPEEIYAYLN